MIKGLQHLAVIAAGVLVMTPAAADPVLYEIQSEYSAGGFSASWMHGATGCAGIGPNSEDTLYMCGNPQYAITGYIEGHLDDELLTITGGSMNVGGTDYDVYEGQLGTFGGSAVWGINIEHFGEFLFESLSMGSGMPNYFDGNSMVLWGQNLDAYVFDPGFRNPHRWGMDLYATRVKVPEPSALALFLMGLAALVVTTNRRRRSSLQRVDQRC